ncbi:MAG: DUF2795 domain-containing protein [Chloroflexi bacterium]|jgi:hypothetical protein|nr:DUF2795 domain-containing protein [Chloroflexota bacterium]
MARQGQGRTMANVSTAEVQSYLGGIDYPANATKVADYAREHGAPSEVVELLNSLPKDKEYHSAADLNQAIGQIK